MRVVINKNNIYDYLILSLIYLQLVIFEFIGLGRYLTWICCCLIIVRLLTVRKKLKAGSIGVICIALASLYLLSAVRGNPSSISITKSNLIMQIYPLLYALYLSYLAGRKPEIIDTVLKRSFILFNATLLVNYLVLYRQITVPYSIAAKATSAVITYYEDTISGLFAYASTHVVCLFTIFVILYNLSYSKSIQRVSKRRLLFLYTFFIAVIGGVISLYNDNKMFFLLLPLTVFIHWFADPNKKISNRLTQVIIVLGFLPVILALLYNLNNGIKVFFDRNFFRLFAKISKSLFLGNTVSGSTERVAIIVYALERPSTWLFGDGVSSAGFYQSGLHGFNHFGQASIGSLLILTGIWYTTLITILYWKLFKTVAENKRNHRVSIGIVLLLIVLMIYSQCITRTNIMTTLLLIMLTFRMRQRYINFEVA